MRPVRCLEKSDKSHPVTRHHIPEERRPQPHRCEILYSGKVFSSFDYIASKYNSVTK